MLHERVGNGMELLHVFAYANNSYLNYLDLCSRIVRASLKEEFRAAAAKRAEHGLKFALWSNGKQLELSKCGFGAVFGF